MNLLLISGIAENPSMPDFGPSLRNHLEQKKHPGARASSLTAWTLLARGMRALGYDPLPEAIFGENGKPWFADAPLHFSLSHSGGFAAALISSDPCAVDVEAIRPDVGERLRSRCLNARELELGCDFFECWTKKECIGKLDGRGIPSHPSKMNSLDPAYAGCFFHHAFRDASGRDYLFTALCMNREAPMVQKIEPEELCPSPARTSVN